MASVPAFVKNEICKTANISAEFCRKLGWFRLEKNGGGALNPRPLVSASQNPFVFQQPIGRKFPTQKRTSPAGPLQGNRPKTKGREGAGYGGPRSRGEALGFWPGAGPCPGVCPWGGLGEPGPEALRPQRPQPVPRCRSPGGPAPWGRRTPRFQRGKCILLLTDPASKNKKD